MVRFQKHLNKTKDYDKKVIAKGRKYLARQLKTQEKYLDFMEVWEPGFKGKLFLQFMVLDPKSDVFGSTATYEIEDKDK